LDILIDSNILLDIITEDKKWFRWSSETLARYAEDNALAVNPIIYAEISIGFEKIEEVEEVLSKDYFRRLPLPWEAAFLAGKCFALYRKKGGKRRSPLPDFYIGAHAAVAGMALMTRDRARYQTYFPKLNIIAPND
jgi:predicted nucleic acid-binding protein